MDAVAETEVSTDPPITDETVRVLELPVVAIGRTPQKSDFGPRRDPDAVQHRGCTGVAPKDLNRRLEPQHLLDQAGEKGVVGGQAVDQLWPAVEEHNGTADQVGHRVGAGQDQIGHQPDHLLVVQRIRGGVVGQDLHDSTGRQASPLSHRGQRATSSSSHTARR